MSPIRTGRKRSTSRPGCIIDATSNRSTWTMFCHDCSGIDRQPARFRDIRCMAGRCRLPAFLELSLSPVTSDTLNSMERRVARALRRQGEPSHAALRRVRRVLAVMGDRPLAAPSGSCFVSRSRQESRNSDRPCCLRWGDSTRDLEIWGRGSKCRFPLPTDDLFASLIGQLD